MFTLILSNIMFQAMLDAINRLGISVKKSQYTIAVMTFWDNPQMVINHIRHSCVTSDDTG